MGGSQSSGNPDPKSKPCICCASGTIDMAEEAKPKTEIRGGSRSRSPTRSNIHRHKVKKHKKKKKPRKKKKGRSHRKKSSSRSLLMEVPRNRQRVCPDSDPLHPHPLHKFKTTQKGWRCNDCGGYESKGTVMFRCEYCDYDLCRGCHKKVVFKKLELYDLADNTPNPSYCDLMGGMESIILKDGESLTTVKAAIKWKDQGHGEQKGRVCLRLTRSGKVMGTCDIFGPAPHVVDKHFALLDQSNPGFAEQILKQTMPGDKLSVGYLVGEGEGQELHIQSLELYVGVFVSIAELEANCIEHHATMFTTDLEGWECNSCLEKLPIKSTMYGCRDCDVDFCKTCKQKLKVTDLRQIPRAMRPKPTSLHNVETCTELSASHVESEIGHY